MPGNLWRRENSLADQFDPITKRIGDMTSPYAGNACIVCNFDSPGPQAICQPVIVAATQCGMRFLGWTKVRLYSEMNLYDATFEPASTALGQLRRLANFVHPEQFAVKSASFVFCTRRHGKLHVIDGYEWRTRHAIIVT
jgi:hypothetical protein